MAGMVPRLPHLPGYLQSGEAFPARCSGKFHPIQLDLLAILGGPENLFSVSKATAVSSQGQKPQGDSAPLGSPRACFVLSPKTLGLGLPWKRWQRPEVSLLIQPYLPHSVNFPSVNKGPLWSVRPARALQANEVSPLHKGWEQLWVV